MHFSPDRSPANTEPAAVFVPEQAVNDHVDVWDLPRDIDPSNGFVRTVEGRERGVQALDHVWPSVASLANKDTQVSI